MALPRGIRNNNPLNIRKGNDWQGERHPQTDKEFEEFESLTMGFRAGFKLMKNFISGFNGRQKPCDNLEKIIRRWAPELENDTESYIKYVSETTGIHRRQKIYFNNRWQMCRIVQAMAIVECGVKIDIQVVQSGYDLL